MNSSELYCINTDFIVRENDTNNNRVILWNPESGLQITIGHGAYSILTQFAFPISIKKLLLSVKPERRDTVESVVHSFIESSLIVLANCNKKYEKDFLMRGLFNAPIKSFSEVLEDESIDMVALGVEYDAGVSNREGAKTAPDTIRKVATSIFKLNDDKDGMWDTVQKRRILENTRVADIGNIGDQIQTRNGKVFDRLKTIVSSLCKEGKKPVILGGDHSITWAIVQGYIESGYDKFGIIHFDAHSDYLSAIFDGDWRTYLHHGNVMSWIAGRKEIKTIAQFGVRQMIDEDPEETSKIRLWAGKSGLDLSAEQYQSELDFDIPWHITVDVDVLDPSVVPGTGTPLPGGLTINELEELLQRVCLGRKIIGVDIVELIGDNHELSALAAADILLREMDIAARSDI